MVLLNGFDWSIIAAFFVIALAIGIRDVPGDDVEEGHREIKKTNRSRQRAERTAPEETACPTRNW